MQYLFEYHENKKQTERFLIMTANDFRNLYNREEFNEKYNYNGNDLGAVCKKDSITFKLWSPLAKQVTLRVYENDSCPVSASYPMEKGEKGVWEFELAHAGHGTYYDYELDFQGEKTVSADPWAKAAGCNGVRSMAVDLEKTNPPGWETDKRLEHEKDQVIYEIHVKDFSYDEASGVPEKYRGKYKAFTLENTTLNNEGKKPTCMAYLKELGVTHVQLLPVYDYGSVDEAGEDSQFNWGYDPLNYNVPEGSYSTDPHNGEVRIRELKEAILALHRQGIGVIMDVVYNHTYSLDSWFNRTNPCYFYRQYEDGSFSDGSDCGNDVASERAMCGKYILESVLYWAEEYHMDGFRFDLMGLLDTELLDMIRRELDLRYGKGKILLYGEPWSAGESPMQKGFHPCQKKNIHFLDENVGVFCDNTRDCIKGHVFYEEVAGFVNGGKDLEQEILDSVTAWVGAKEDFQVKAPSQIISYVSAHDNLTLWDKIKITLKPELPFETRDEEVVRACKLAAAIYFCCQGRIFFQAGEEGARTKLGDENSFRSSPEINCIDWKRCYEYEDVLKYYKGLIALRRQMDGITDKSQKARENIFGKKIAGKGVVEFLVKNQESRWKTLAVCFNSTNETQEIRLPEGNWELLADGSSSFLWENPETVSGIQKAAPVSAAIYGKKS